MADNRLTRDTEHAMIGGVCAGIANRFETDPTLVRMIALAVAAVTAGTGILIYLVLWLIMPAPGAAPGIPNKDAITGEVRDASARAKEVASIIGRAAKQAASEVNEVTNKRGSASTRSASTGSGVDGTGAPYTSDEHTATSPSTAAPDPVPSEGNVATPPPPVDPTAPSSMTSTQDPTAPYPTQADPPAGDDAEERRRQAEQQGGGQPPSQS